MAELVEQCKELVASAMKDGIYQASIKVLGQYGFEGMTMDRVAEGAGISKGSLYNYFRNKQELVHFIFDKTVEPASQKADEIIARPVPALEKLESILRLWFEHFVTERGMFDFLFKDPTARGLLASAERIHHVQAIEKFRTIFQQAVSEGAFRQIDTTQVAEVFFGAVKSVIEHQIDLGEDRPVDESVDLLMNVFLHGLERR